MDRYDELLGLLRNTQGMTWERAARVKADDTILIMVGPHSDRYADIRNLVLNEDGSEWCSVEELKAEIEKYWPQAIATVALMKQRAAIAKERE